MRVRSHMRLRWTGDYVFVQVAPIHMKTGTSGDAQQEMHIARSNVIE